VTDQRERIEREAVAIEWPLLFLLSAPQVVLAKL